MGPMKQLAPFVLLLSCARPATAPVIDVSHTKPIEAVRPIAIAPPADPLSEWHWRNTKADPEKTTDDGRPLYLAVESFRTIMGGGCSVSGKEGEDAYILCDSDMGRVVGNKIDLAWGRDIPIGDFVPAGVHHDGERQWVYANSSSDGANDAFFDAVRSVTIKDGGSSKWERIETEASLVDYRGGHLLSIVPPVAPDPRCPDASCSNVIPKFRGWGLKELPDFSSLSGKIAWIHPQELGRDFNIAIDKDGPVHVLMRALDLKTKKRGFGVATWTSKGGAKFEWLPAPLDTYGVDAAWSNRADAADGKATFELVLTNTKNVTTEYVASWDGKHWSAKKDHYPDAPEAEKNYDPDQRFATKISAEDEWVDDHGMLYRTLPPDEVLVQTQRWGHLHPFAPPAEEDCPTPFAVLDRMEKERFAALGAARPEGWGVIDDEEIAERAVVMETKELVVIGVPFGTTEAANAFLDHQPWLDGGDGMETPHVTVCARPVAPTKFEPSK